MEHDQWLCLCYQNPDNGSKTNDRKVQKNTYIKSKGQCKDKISVSKIDIYIDLLSINFNLIYTTLCLPLDQWFWNLHFTNNNIIANSVVS